jgi:APA family basic amino acid/polyamine antiporter
LAISIIALLTFLNTRGIENGKAIQRIFTSAKLIALFALIIVGIYFGFHKGVFANNMAHAWDAKQLNSDNISFTSVSGMSLATALGLAMIGSLFSSDAWNNVTFIAGEVEKPQRNIPLGLFFGVSIVTLIYVMANVAYLCLLPVDGLKDSATVVEQGIMFAQKDRVGTAALFVVFGDLAKYLMAALIMVSTFGCNNGLILAGSRLFSSMANDGLFFKKAAKLNKFNVPSNAISSNLGFFVMFKRFLWRFIRLLYVLLFNILHHHHCRFICFT